MGQSQDLSRAAQRRFAAGEFATYHAAVIAVAEEAGFGKVSRAPEPDNRRQRRARRLAKVAFGAMGMALLTVSAVQADTPAPVSPVVRFAARVAAEAAVAVDGITWRPFIRGAAAGRPTLEAEDAEPGAFFLGVTWNHRCGGETCFAGLEVHADGTLELVTGP